MLIGSGVAVYSQTENDDLYFTKKDRQLVNQSEIRQAKKLEQNSATYMATAKTKTTSVPKSTEGYTGRTINPDYQPGYASGLANGYFDSNYQPASINQNPIYAGSNYSPYYGNSGWGNYNRWGVNSMYSSYYSSWGMSPYCYNGFSPYGYGNGWNSYSNWNSPYSYWGNSYYGNGFGWGMNSGWGLGWNYGWGNGYYAQPIIIVNQPDNNYVNRVYGKRTSRNENLVTPTTSRGTQVVAGNNGSNRGGRSANAGTTTTNAYYQRGWRQDPSINPAVANTGSGQSTNGSRSTGRSNNVFTNWGTNNNNNSSWSTGTFGGDSRSSGGFSTGGGGSRSSSGSSGGSSGGSRSSGGTRGRN